MMGIESAYQSISEVNDLINRARPQLEAGPSTGPSAFSTALQAQTTAQPAARHHRSMPAPATSAMPAPMPQAELHPAQLGRPFSVFSHGPNPSVPTPNGLPLLQQSHAHGSLPAPSFGQNAQPFPFTSGVGGSPPFGVPPPPGARSLEWLDSLGHQFGLEHDPGNGQTTGGVHAAGSYHYSGRATDFGTARNSMEQLNGVARFAYDNAELFTEFFWDHPVPGIGTFHIVDGEVRSGAFGGHADHVHMAR